MGYENNPPRLIGGRLILDFLNTADWSVDGVVLDEKIQATTDLDIWMDALGLAGGASKVSNAELGALRQFRTSVRKIFITCLNGGEAETDALLELNQAARSISKDLLRGDSSKGTVFGDSAPLREILAVSAIATLGESRDLERIKLCPGHDCGWLFLDETKNGRRRWCTMETCGNRAKANRHYKMKTAGRN
jgi:predicted RNA-binding Zn ribbon-like protein